VAGQGPFFRVLDFASYGSMRHRTSKIADFDLELPESRRIGPNTEEGKTPVMSRMGRTSQKQRAERARK
jgi:hypothetical protein